jgi:hypothetical protein
MRSSIDSGLTSGNLSLSNLLGHPYVSVDSVWCYFCRFIKLDTASCCKERDTVHEIGAEVARLETFLGNTIDLLGRAVLDLEFRAEFLLGLGEHLVGRDCITGDTDDLVLGEFRLFEQGGDIASNIICGCGRDWFISRPRDVCGAFLEVDTRDWEWQVQTKE